MGSDREEIERLNRKKIWLENVEEEEILRARAGISVDSPGDVHVEGHGERQYRDQDGMTVPDHWTERDGDLTYEEFPFSIRNRDRDNGGDGSGPVIIRDSFVNDLLAPETL